MGDYFCVRGSCIDNSYGRLAKFEDIACLAAMSSLLEITLDNATFIDHIEEVMYLFLNLSLYRFLEI